MKENFCFFICSENFIIFIKNFKKVLTFYSLRDIIIKPNETERYRSGHNEAVLKTV